METNKYYLQSKMKSTGIAYVCWFILGIHYAYLGKWGWQILYWITIGGFGVWAIVDLFLMPSKVDNYNRNIANQIAAIESRERI